MRTALSTLSPIGLLLLLCVSANSSQRASDQKRYNRNSALQHIESGTLRLIIQAFVEEFIHELQSDVTLTLPEALAEHLRKRFGHLHHHISQHPALREKRLWVGGMMPTFDPDNLEGETMEEPSELHDDSPWHPYKSKTSSRRRKHRHVLLADEICRTDRQWEMINQTTDMYAHAVEVIQQADYHQFVFVYRCVAQGGSCVGISPLYNSECEMRYGWMMLMHKRADDATATPKWGYVAVPHHCACKITPKYLDEENDHGSIEHEYWEQ